MASPRRSPRRRGVAESAVMPHAARGHGAHGSGAGHANRIYRATWAMQARFDHVIRLGLVFAEFSAEETNPWRSRHHRAASPLQVHLLEQQCGSGAQLGFEPGEQVVPCRCWPCGPALSPGARERTCRPRADRGRAVRTVIGTSAAVLYGAASPGATHPSPSPPPKRPGFRQPRAAWRTAAHP